MPQDALVVSICVSIFNEKAVSSDELSQTSGGKPERLPRQTKLHMAAAFRHQGASDAPTRAGSAPEAVLPGTVSEKTRALSAWSLLCLRRATQCTSCESGDTLCSQELQPKLVGDLTTTARSAHF